MEYEDIKKINDEKYEQYDILKDCSYNLGRIADALYTVGNSQLSEDIQIQSDAIRKAAKKLEESHYEETNIRFKQANEASASILESCLSVATRDIKGQ